MYRKKLSCDDYNEYDDYEDYEYEYYDDDEDYFDGWGGDSSKYHWPKDKRDD